MKKLVILTGIVIATATTAVAQTEVTAGVTRGKEFGVTYTLPKTQIEIAIRANKVSYVPGEFYKYAERYLRLNNVTSNPQEYWELVNVQVNATGIPDSENVYFVKMKDKTVAPLIELTEDGIIKSINRPTSIKKGIPATPLTAAIKKSVNPRDFLTEEILMSSSSAKMAELIAKEIYNIRESRNALVRGQADNMPKDGEQLKLMLDNLEEQEHAMTEMFAGTRKIEEKVFTIRLTPNKEFKNEIAFRFSKKLGIVANNDLAGEPAYINLKNMKTLHLPQEEGKRKVEGIAYNVPGKALVTLTKGKDILFEGELPITQFGSVEYLAPALFNKKATTMVSFNPATGGLVKVDREEAE
ncbi:MAG: DUF4831 family protein [Bacteroides sp.]